MNDRSIISIVTVPCLAPHMRLRFDKTRQTWMIQAPERSFVLDSIAHAIVSRCDGLNPIGAIVDELCAAYPEAPRDMIENDTIALVQNFCEKGVMLA